jgi:RHS repeat-associated protein
MLGIVGAVAVELRQMLDRLTDVIQSGSAGGEAVALKGVALTYNADNQFSTITRYAGSIGSTALVATSAYGYDGAGRLTSLSDTAQGNTLAGYTWTYNMLDEVTSFNSSQHSAEDLVYSYDATGQLIGVGGVNSDTEEGNSSTDEAYSYDAAGNRQSATSGSTTSASSTGANNILTSDGTYNYQYDADGNRTKETDIATGVYTTYAYDDRNRLTAVTSYNSAGAVTQTVDYTYDAFDRQISETVTSSGVTTTAKFVYDGQNIVATLDGTNALTNRYLDGPAVDQVFADEQFAPTTAGEMPTSAGTVIWPLVDNLGTDRDLVEYNAATGVTSVVDHLTYNSFGAVTSESNPAISYLFGYTGFVRDLATGLDHSQTRYYDPVDGIWTQEDPLGFGGGDANLNRYVENNSTLFVDPTGLWQITGGPTQSWAIAKSEDRDTLGGLANKLHLEFREISRWVKDNPSLKIKQPLQTKPISEIGADEILCEGQRVYVPNTVVVVTPELGLDISAATHRAQAKANSAARDLLGPAGGFKINYVNVGTDPQKMRDAWRTEGIYGYIFGGHGGNGGILFVGSNEVTPSAVRPPYKLAFVYIYACYSATGEAVAHDINNQPTSFKYWSDFVSSNGGTFEGIASYYFLWSTFDKYDSNRNKLPQ